MAVVLRVACPAKRLFLMLYIMYISPVLTFELITEKSQEDLARTISNISHTHDAQCNTSYNRK